MVAASSSACQSETPSVDCQLEENSAIAASPLMLSPTARVDRVAQWFVLLGADGTSATMIRWATIELNGQAGPEHAVPVPAFTAGPWFAVAGDKTAGDSVLVAFGKPAATAADLDIFVIAVPSDGSAAASAPSLLTTIAGAAKAGAAVNVVMASSVTGMRAALAWIAPTTLPAGTPPPRGPAAGAGVIKTLVLAGSGMPVAAPLPIETVTGSTCLGFAPGRADLTIGYLRYETPTTPPDWSMTELGDNGASEFSLAIPLATEAPSCPHLAPTMAGGYVLAWQDISGSRIGVYDIVTNHFYPRLFVTAVEFGGADVQPPVMGLGEVSRDFAVLFARARSTEVWRIGALGTRRPGALSLPSVLGDIGQVSAIPLGGAVYATYADYSGTSTGPEAGAAADVDAASNADAAAPDAGTTADGGAPSDAAPADRNAGPEAPPARAGQRLFVKISCF
jgi:hypothetical protein